MLNILTVALQKLSMKGVSWPCVTGSVTFYEGLQNDPCVLNTYQYDIYIEMVVLLYSSSHQQHIRKHGIGTSDLKTIFVQISYHIWTVK